ncbi:MAG: hypothetical protein ACLSHM_10980 [Vescimonas sp.]
MWYAKMYFSGEKEFFENDAFGMQGLPSKRLELPFLESLLTFLELDEKRNHADAGTHQRELGTLR